MALLQEICRSRLQVSTTRLDPPISPPLSRTRLASHPIRHRVRSIRVRAASPMPIRPSQGARRPIPLVRQHTRARVPIRASPARRIRVSRIPETAARLGAQLISRVESASPLAQHISLV